MNAIKNKFKIKIFKKSKIKKKTYNIAIAGNPNVGKSTVFNALTGMHQHTGNWPGKTIECALGEYSFKNTPFKITDLPGTYSLMANSPEEEIARDFICFQNPDAIIITLDATCLERNLNLALQILGITNKAVICVNLIDEAARKKIKIDLDELSLQLGVPVVATNARSKKGLHSLMDKVQKVCTGEIKTFKIKNYFNKNLENSINSLSRHLKNELEINAEWLSLQMLENNKSIRNSIKSHLDYEIFANKKIKGQYFKERKKLFKALNCSVSSQIAQDTTKKSEEIFSLCVKIENGNYDKHDRTIDKILTSKITGFPIMILLLLGIFWITLSGANYPSELIATGLFWAQDKLLEFFVNLGTPSWLYGILILGVYKTLAWVVSVMLPPMAIFFPLFTFLEDVGYLPRVAFNLDKIFKKCGAHGKQALTMCMGLGCNACGIMGCRIIDSPRERLIALITNNFIPCNGRFPLLISIITMFFIGGSFCDSLFSTLILTSVVIFSIIITFLTSKLLSKTILKGAKSSFILELPPYRKPQIGKILVRSIFDRTIFVLKRAIIVAAPAGLVIWLMSNIKIGDLSVLMHCSSFLDPFAKFIGLDGVILMAFILGFPANEIVFPIIIMSYMCENTILSLENPAQLHTLLINNGWTYITAICVMLFSLMHFPCGTTCLTIKKETGSLKWTFLSFIIPTAIGIVICAIVANALKFINILI